MKHTLSNGVYYTVAVSDIMIHTLANLDEIQLIVFYCQHFYIYKNVRILKIISTYVIICQFMFIPNKLGLQINQINDNYCCSIFFRCHIYAFHRINIYIYINVNT